MVTTVLDIVAGIMEKYGNTDFIIEGHTDTSGPKSFNQKLSEMRANAVKDYLVNKGISEDQLSTVDMVKIGQRNLTTPEREEFQTS